MFGFPHPVNEKAARVVAGVVFALAVTALATSAYWLLPVLAYGFVARVLTGPTLSPLGWVASRVVAPRLGPPKEVSGPPKRFAQGIGAMLTVAGSTLVFGFDQTAAADVLLAALVVASGLEAFAGLCLGCKIFGLLMRAGVIPERVCAECGDIWSRPRTAHAESSA